MTTTHRKNPPIPPPLASCFRLKEEDSLTLLTGVNTANANWLVLRFIYAALSDVSSSAGQVGRRRAGAGSPEAGEIPAVAGLEPRSAGAGNGGMNVLLVSWLREWEYWRSECKRAVGIDLHQMNTSGRFAFIDGLSKLFLPDMNVKDAATTSSSIRTSPTSSTDRSAFAPARARATTPPSQSQSNKGASSGILPLTSPTLAHIHDAIKRILDSLRDDAASRQTLLILDHPSMLLQTTTSPPITSQEVSSLLVDLRLHPSVHSTVVSLPADAPLLKAAAQSANASADQTAGLVSSLSETEPSKLTPLEAENAAIAVQTAMLCRCVISCRALETGWASDVSGVLRVTSGGHGRRNLAGDEPSDEMGQTDDAASESESATDVEWLYYIASDSSVNVWSRGSSAGTL